MSQSVQYELPTLTADGKARLASIEAISVESTPTSLVAYSSLGRTLIAGSRKWLTVAATHLEASQLNCFFLITENDNPPDSDEDNLPTPFMADDFTAQGYLGAFSITVTRDERILDFGKTVGIESGKFDMVFDLSSTAKIEAQIPPPGYFRIEPDDRSEKSVRNATEEMSHLIGNFEKPKYFNYNPDICAHSRSGITACTRCIDACPTDAIISIGELIEVNSHLCQGGGACATACPTGAVTYAYPPAQNQLETLRQMLLKYRELGGSGGVVLFFDREHGSPLVDSQINNLGENILPVEVEEVGSIGLDMLLSVLAYGAAGAAVLCVRTAELVTSELKFQISLLDELLHGLGFNGNPARLVYVEKDGEIPDSELQNLALMKIDPARFAPSGIKRTDLRTALEHLHLVSPLKPESIPLPENSPFGQVMVDTNTCTLCMGCVSVCPASALEAGGEVPKLAFIENNCVQCGLCESACPESSITRTQRYLFDTDGRMRARTMNEDAPFHCRVCGKPFATTSMLNRMRDKLKDHWMFQKPDAVARLEMCEDCRVKDMFAAEGGFPRDEI